MEKKILVYVAIGIIIAAIGGIAILPSTGILKNIIPHGSTTPSALTSIVTDVKPIDIQYNGSSVLSVTDRDATVETKFRLTNPNNNTLIIEMVSYDVYVNGVKIGHGQYGQKYEGSWQSSYYLPLIQHDSETITNNAQIHNDGNNPQTWSLLQNGTSKIRVSGTAYYSTNTAFSGQNLSTDFDFMK